jgi:hypothetical protein
MVSTATPYAAYSPVTAHKERIVATYPRLLSSSDGLNWRQEENKGDLPPLAAEKPILSFNDNLVLLSGAFSYVHDGKRWTKVETPFRGWLAFSAIVHNGRIIVAGGATRKPSSEQGYSNYTSQNEVWTSNDPLDPGSWVQLSASAEWSARMWPALIVHRDQLYLIGGYENSAGENVADIWRSNHGAHWDEVSTRNNPPSRHAPTVFSCNGKIILLAGNTNDGTRVQNDIWAIDI